MALCRKIFAPKICQWGHEKADILLPPFLSSVRYDSNMEWSRRPSVPLSVSLNSQVGRFFFRLRLEGRKERWTNSHI